MFSIKIEKPSYKQLQELNIETWTQWECEPSTFDWEYECDEIAYVLEGKVKITTKDGTTVEINQGDLVSFPKGLKCTWNVIKKIRKVYTFK